jgi:hypothetical protein
MYVVAIAWIYVVVLMAIVEAMSPNGSLLGAFFTLLLYGALPLSIVLYVMGTPMRRRASLAAQRAANAGLSSEPDRGGHAPGDPVPPEREEA